MCTSTTASLQCFSIDFSGGGHKTKALPFFALMEDPDEDKTLWTEDRIQSEISKMLPTGVYLECEWHPHFRQWQVALLKETSDEDEPDEELWRSGHFDKRMALFEAYGQLWSTRRKPVTSVWAPVQSRPSRESVTRHVLSKEEDPPDLDPEEIASVYRTTKPN